MKNAECRMKKRRNGRFVRFFIFHFSCFILLTANAIALDITLDGANRGRTFDGIGAVSAGASSRLLIDYPEPQRSQILDYLFKPNYGAALQHLKIEIGGEINSTDGTEPTHERTRGSFDFSRGYEWWLAQQAKTRNPNIALDCLAWGAPGWIGNGNYYSQDMSDYIVSFIKGAQTNYGFTFDFTGTHNEASLSATRTAWIKQLRSTLDANGLQSVKLVAADEWGGAWEIVTNATYGLRVDSALSNSIARIGAHYPGMTSPASAKTCSQPLWDSEEGSHGTSFSAALTLAQIYNRNYILGKMTATEVWSPITSYYDILAAPNSGLMKANTPWSGAYFVGPHVWATAHTTQFAAPGWIYLEGGASALLPSGGSLVTLESTNHSDYSIVVETSDASSAQTVTFHLTNGLSSAALNVWQTSATNQFANGGQISPTNGIFSCTFQPGCIYSLTTTTGQAKGNATSPVAKPFPLPFKDDFENYAASKTPKFFTDQAGTFETFIRADGQGKCLRQVLPQRGIPWTAEWQPYTLIGDASWSDYDVSADVLIETNGGLVFVMGRVGKGAGFSDATPRGYWLALNNATAKWELHSSSNLLASGAANVATNSWHNLRLALQGVSLRCFVDGALVTNFSDAIYTSGMAGIGCGWHGAQFDNFTLRQLHRGSGFNFALSATASASSFWQDDPTYAASMANDGDPDTRWNSAYPTEVTEWLELDWPSPVTFNQTTCAQFDDRISGYQIQHWSGSNWVTDVNGGHMGAFAADYFPAVTSSKVRLVLTNFDSAPSISEFDVFKIPPPPATNLAPAASASASSVWQNDSTYAAGKANDNDFSTRWNSAAGDTNGAWLELDWPSAVNFNRTTLSQFSDRVTSYKIQHWNGAGWSDDFSGGQLGASATENFPTVTSSKARFFVATATNVPSIYEFQVFDDPPAATSAVAPICINEWMINNARTLLDPADGKFEPWFELYNAGATNVSLAGYFLTGLLTNLFQFQIPSGYAIAPGGFLLVWTDGQTAQNSGGDLHANFSLQQSQLIALADAAGQIVDAVDLLPQAPDVSSGGIPDGDPAIVNSFAATARQSNNQIWISALTRRVADGAMLLNFAGIPFAPHRLLAANDLNSSWTTLATVFADGLGWLSFADTNASGRAQQFYRAVSP
jgi:Glycosyl hydrolase family 59/Lamin Tail Domain/F5/8 type C domain